MSYFRYGNSAQAFNSLRWYARWRLKVWWGKRWERYSDLAPSGAILIL